MITAPFGHRMKPEIFDSTFISFIEQIYNEVTENIKLGKPLHFLNY